MSYERLQQHWHITVKDDHHLYLDVVEGTWWDRMELYVDNRLVATATPNPIWIHGYRLFDIDGRTHELRWVWSREHGNPISILIMHKSRILARYGTDAAAKLDLKDD